MKKLLFLVLPLALTACSSQPQPTGPSDEAIMTQNKLLIDVGQRLNQSSERALTALNTLSMVARANAEPALPDINEEMLPASLRSKYSMEYTGRGDLAVKELARLMGYQFEMNGNATTDAFVSVRSYDVSAAKLIQDLGRQIHPYAEIYVDPNNNKLTYVMNAGNPAKPVAPTANLRSGKNKGEVRK